MRLASLPYGLCIPPTAFTPEPVRRRVAGMKQILLMIAVVALVGCAVPMKGTVKNNNANMAKLSVRMTKAQVLETMGPAGKTEGYATKSGGFMEFLFYRTQVADIGVDTIIATVPTEIAGSVTDKHWTPVCIIDGKVKGWGRNFYDDTIKIRKEIIKK